MKSTIPALLLSAVFAQCDAESTYSIQIDDDLFSGASTDADYTGGGSITRSGELPLSVTRALGLEDAQLEHHYEMEFGVAAFTPADISSTAAVVGDRPYAGLVYVSGSLTATEEKNRSSVTTLLAGVLGSRWVPNAQHAIHHAIGANLPQGWDHQISDGGEVTLRLMHERRWMSDVVAVGANQVQWLYRASGAVGYLTDLTAGVAARYGRFSEASWNIHRSATGLGDRGLFDASHPRDRFIYGSFSATVPIYNALLQGQFRHSDVTVDAGDIRRLVPEASLGFVTGFAEDRVLHYFIRAQLSDTHLPVRRETTWYGGLSVSW